MFRNLRMARESMTTTCFSMKQHLALAASKINAPHYHEFENTRYFMPPEEELHEGTWLQWPHNYGWDRCHIQRYEESWIQMAKELHTGERVHIIVYNSRGMRRLRSLLRHRGLEMSKIDFWVAPTNDVWVRDNGPIFVRNQDGIVFIGNFKFNGWGGKADCWLDDRVPAHIAKGLGLSRLDIPMVNEGGSFEVDGRGTLMAKKSSILNPNRNPGMSLTDAEQIFQTYLGVTNFIWLEGEPNRDITDDHVDGTARFAGSNTIVTLHPDHFSNPSEYDVLVHARNAQGEPYTIVHLPTTSKAVLDSGVEGIYVNYYVGNDVVLVPVYNDPMDHEAINILSGVYPSRRVVGVNMEQVHVDGGGVHCVTQQQPIQLGYKP